MIPDVRGAASIAGAASLFFLVLGLPLARRVVGGGMAALAIAPALGWAVFSAVAFPVLSLTGFHAVWIDLLCVACLAAGGYGVARTRAVRRLAWWPVPLAWCVAGLPALAILPKLVPGGMLLAPPMFDHVKVAMVDSVLRSGLPIQNPFFNPPGGGALTYYYLWHVTTGVIASLLHVGGWPAEAGMTWFTAFASMLLMMGLAQAIAGRSLACALVALLSLTATARPLLVALVGPGFGGIVPGGADFGGWLNQAAWVPQHLQSACCVVVAVLLMQAMADSSGWLAPVLLGTVAAAGFGSSAWVGGLAFAAVAPVVGVLLLLRIPAGRRPGFVARAALAALLAGCLAAPFLLAQIGEAAGRQGTILAFQPYGVLGDAIPPGWRTALDIPAFWLFLPFELPAVLPLAAFGLVRARGLAWRRETALPVLSGAALACLVVAWLLRSTIDNNDLGWRAVLPPILILTPFAAAWLAETIMAARWAWVAAACCLVLAGAPAGLDLLRGYIGGERPGEPEALAQSVALWQAVRDRTGPADRIANNPRFLADVTPWPVNISFALLSDRPSCYGNWETVLAYGGVSRARLIGIEAIFRRVFDGHADPGDVTALAWRFDCAAVVLVPSDGAWLRDPFAQSAAFQLASAPEAGWRFYRRRMTAAFDAAVPR